MRHHSYAVLTYGAAYDADAKMYRQAMPAGMAQDVTFDEAGQPVGMAYTGQVTPVTGTDSDGTPATGTSTTGVWMAWTQTRDAAGRVIRDYTGQGAAFDGTAGTTTAPAANGPVQKLGDGIGFDRAYSYDGAGRLTQVADRTATASGLTVQPGGAATSAVPCQIRSYVYAGTLGLNGNRTSSRVEDHADGSCTSTPTTSTVKSYAYDTADRAITGANGTGTYTYDPLGRVTTLPAADAPDTANGDVTLGYFDNDLPASVKQGGTDTQFTLDVQGRRLTQTTTGAGWAGATSKIVRHYTDGSDNPAWVDTTDATTGTVTQTAFAESIAGDLGAQLSFDGAATLTLANLHGDVVTTITLPASQPEGTPATTITGWSDYTEFGTPRNPWATIAIGGPAGYGWLGAKQRATTLETAGLTLMGDRYYNPIRGQFTALDPEPGGNANAYTYPLDPIGSYDIDGHHARYGRYSHHARYGRYSHHARYGRSHHSSYRTRGRKSSYRHKRSGDPYPPWLGCGASWAGVLIGTFTAGTGIGLVSLVTGYLGASGCTPSYDAPYNFDPMDGGLPYGWALLSM